jgi:hypothetical protein
MKSLYNSGDDVIVVTSEDCTGRKTSKEKVNANDSHSVGRVFQSFIDKYGLNLKIVESIDNGGLKWLDADEEFKW